MMHHLTRSLSAVSPPHRRRLTARFLACPFSGVRQFSDPSKTSFLPTKTFTERIEEEEDDPIPSPNVDNFGNCFAYTVDLNRGGVGEAFDFGMEGDQRKVLPPELISRNVMKLSCESTAGGGNCDVYLIGTIHVSTKSCQEVQAVISYLKPQVVFLELCSKRFDRLNPRNLKVPTMREMLDMWRKKHNVFGILLGWFYAKVASKLEVLPGAEFLVAFDEAMKYGGKVVLGDRPAQVTLWRTWVRMPIWHKTILTCSLLLGGFLLPNPKNLNKMLKEMEDVKSDDVKSHVYPTLLETLLHERDQYMSSMLLRVAREHSLVVAVVGKGHLPGIKKNWNQPVEVENLLEMPSMKPAGPMVKVLKSLGVAAAGVAIIYAIYISSKK